MVHLSTLDRHGVHGPNSPFDRVSRTVGGRPSESVVWWRLGLARARWIKLLATDHSPVDAQNARAAGMQVLVRVKGEGTVYHRDVLDAIGAYRGKAQVLEIGNEPEQTDEELWTHAWYVEKVLRECLDAAHNAGMRLCIGGWPASAPPPSATTDLGSRLLQLYNRFDLVGVHVYDPWDLTNPGPQEHLRSWLSAFARQPVMITEYGIAARALDSGTKARRYAAWLDTLPDRVEAAFAFLLGGTPDFAAFSTGGYDERGQNSYWLDDAGWEAFGAAIGP